MNNHIRDVSLKEDKMRSKKRSYSAQWGLKNFGNDNLAEKKCQNKKAQLEDFGDNFGNLILTLKIMNFL